VDLLQVGVLPALAEAIGSDKNALKGAGKRLLLGPGIGGALGVYTGRGGDRRSLFSLSYPFPYASAGGESGNLSRGTQAAGGAEERKKARPSGETLRSLVLSARAETPSATGESAKDQMTNYWPPRTARARKLLNLVALLTKPMLKPTTHASDGLPALAVDAQ
jgi:hypothetical protein